MVIVTFVIRAHSEARDSVTSATVGYLRASRREVLGLRYKDLASAVGEGPVDVDDAAPVDGQHEQRPDVGTGRREGPTCGRRGL
jgi:hypothetical protein